MSLRSSAMVVPISQNRKIGHGRGKTQKTELVLKTSMHDDVANVSSFIVQEGAGG